MSAPISDDGTYSEQNKDAPEPFRERPRMPPVRQFYVTSAPTEAELASRQDAFRSHHCDGRRTER